MRSSRNSGIAVALLVGVTACGGGLSVRSDYDPSADFSAYRTYSWAQRVPSGDDDPRVYNAIVAGRIQTAVNVALQAKGLELTESNPDFLVGWHGAIEGKVSYTTFHDSYGYGWGWYDPFYGYGGPRITTTRTYRNELVWWGTAQGTIDRKERPPAEEQRRYNDAVAQLLAAFPPGA